MANKIFSPFSKDQITLEKINDGQIPQIKGAPGSTEFVPWEMQIINRIMDFPYDATNAIIHSTSTNVDKRTEWLEKQYEDWANYNSRREDVIQKAPGLTNIIPQQREPGYHTETPSEDFAYNFEKQQQLNVISNTLAQRTANVYHSLNFVNTVANQLIKTQKEIYSGLRNTTGPNPLVMFSHAIGIQAPADKVLEKIRTDLIEHHPDTFKATDTINDCLTKLNGLIASLRDQYNSILSDIKNPTADQPPEVILSAFNKDLYKLNLDTYKRDLTAFVTTHSDKLTPLQKDIITQHVSSDRLTQQNAIESYFQLSKRLDQSLEPTQDRTMFDTMFSLSNYVDAKPLENQSKHHFEYTTALHNEFKKAIHSGQIYHAQGFLNAMWHPTTGEENLANFIDGKLNRRLTYDSTNPKIQNQIYQNEFTKTIPEEVFDNFLQVKNALAAFTARY